VLPKSMVHNSLVHAAEDRANSYKSVVFYVLQIFTLFWYQDCFVLIPVSWLCPAYEDKVEEEPEGLLDSCVPNVFLFDSV